MPGGLVQQRCYWSVQLVGIPRLFTLEAKQQFSLQISLQRADYQNMRQHFQGHQSYFLTAKFFNDLCSSVLLAGRFDFKWSVRGRRTDGSLSSVNPASSSTTLSAGDAKTLLHNSKGGFIAQSLETTAPYSRTLI